MFEQSFMDKNPAKWNSQKGLFQLTLRLSFSMATPCNKARCSHWLRWKDACLMLFVFLLCLDLLQALIWNSSQKKKKRHVLSEFRTFTAFRSCSSKSRSSSQRISSLEPHKTLQSYSWGRIDRPLRRKQQTYQQPDHQAWHVWTFEMPMRRFAPCFSATLSWQISALKETRYPTISQDIDPDISIIYLN